MLLLLPTSQVLLLNTTTKRYYKREGFLPFIFNMNKYLVLILFVIAVVSCTRDSNIKGIADSFEQFIDTLESENAAQADMKMPLLSKLTSQEQARILQPFRDLGDIKYTLEITKQSETIYYLQIKTRDTESIWTDLFIPYEQNKDGQWVMAPVIKSVQTFDIIPAKN